MSFVVGAPTAIAAAYVHYHTPHPSTTPLKAAILPSSEKDTAAAAVVIVVMRKPMTLSRTYSRLAYILSYLWARYGICHDRHSSVLLRNPLTTDLQRWQHESVHTGCWPAAS